MAPPRSSLFHYLLFSCFLLAARRSDAAGAPQLQAIDCSTEGNYTATDAYAANLNQLLAALPITTVSQNGGFFNGTVGQGAATVYGLAMCSADFSRPDCTDCLTAASSNGTGLAKRCPGSVTASIMFDQCMVRYSNRSFFGNNETDIAFSLTSGMVASKKPYSDNLKQGLAYLSAQAAISPERFAASSTAPFALVQCTWDLPSDKCKACIDTLSANASNLFQVGIEGERKSYSCRVRYSNASFTVVPLVTPAGNNITEFPSSVDTTAISSKAIVAGAVTGSLVVVGSIIAVVFCIIRKHQLPYRRLKNERKEGGVMSLEFLNEITSNFSEANILGTGAFAQVYKGVLCGKEIAAVKRLHSAFDTEALKREINNLWGLNHQNIVQLLGYCYETTRQLVEREEGQEFVSEIYIAMIFEYMHKGTLEKYLKDESEGRNWKADYKIIKGTCEGLKYLHKGLKSPMLHLDLKPSNILLSNNMVPKLADFGLSTKLVSDNQTEATPRPFGTRGYSPPEYSPGKDVSEKFDIYSLGVVMLDIISGPEGYKKKAKMTSLKEFTDYVQENWRKRLQGRPTTINKYEYQVKRCLEIAMGCVNADHTQRPSIDDIISKLEETENNTKKKTNIIDNSATTFTSQNEA